MNLSDDVTGVTLQIVEKGADVAAHTAKELIDSIMRLLTELGKQRERSTNSKQSNVSGTDLTEIKPGIAERSALMENARKNGDTLSMSENALTKEDKQFIARKAKEYKIPVAFSNEKSKDNIFATVRTGDLPLFKQICTELMKSKIAERPQTLGNFRCEAWEILFLTAHLNKYDLLAQFIQTADGKNLCVFAKKEAKAIQMNRDAFVQQCMDVKNDLIFDRDEAGFLTIKNLKTGREISFDMIPDRKTLAAEMQEAFGYDELTAQIAAARFGEEMLGGEQKTTFFSDSVQKEFKQAETNLFVKGEEPVCKEYQCWRITPKSDERPRIVFANDAGELALLEPETMTRRQMRDALREQLGVTDRKHQDALINKAEYIAAEYARNEARSADYSFSINDFDTKNALAFEMPLKSMNTEISRTGKQYFHIESTVTAVKKDENGIAHEHPETETLILSFSDKKASLRQLRELYIEQGVPEHIAKQMAKEVFQKAKMQNPVKPVQIEEIREQSMIVTLGKQSAEIPTSEKQTAASKIAETFDVPPEQAAVIVEKAAEIKEEIIASETAENVAAAKPSVTSEPISTELPISSAQPEPELSIPFTQEFLEQVKQAEAAANNNAAASPSFIPNPESAPEARGKLEQNRVAALCAVTGISPEDAAKALKAADLKAWIAAEEAAESKPEPKKVTTFFWQSKEIQISAETVLPSSYEEAAELLEKAAQEAETNDEVQYNQSKPEFGIPEEWESVDFGEPIREREEVEEDDEIEISPAEEQSDVLHYAVPAAEPTVLPELVQEEVAAAVIVIREQQPRYAPENALPKEEDYFDPENNDMDSFMS